MFVFLNQYYCCNISSCRLGWKNFNHCETQLINLKYSVSPSFRGNSQKHTHTHTPVIRMVCSWDGWLLGTASSPLFWLPSSSTVASSSLEEITQVWEEKRKKKTKNWASHFTVLAKPSGNHRSIVNIIDHKGQWHSPTCVEQLWVKLPSKHVGLQWRRV